MNEDTIKISKQTSYEPILPKKAPKSGDVPADDHFKKGGTITDVYNQSRILGAVYGSAVGDALGAPAEFKSRQGLFSSFPEGLREMIAGGLTGGKDGGSYTDDTEMLLCIARGIVDAAEQKEPHHFAHYVSERNKEWAKSCPPDMGGLTRSVLGQVMRGANGHDAAWWAAYESGRADANGALMRNAILFPFVRSAPFVKQMLVTQEICATTHASDQCRSAAAAMTALQIQLCWHTSARKAIRATHKQMKAWGCNEVVLQSFEKIIGEKYKTAAEVPVGGWVIDTLERALWCLNLEAGYEEGLVTCIMMGGDADTAGAVAGALLGTFYGYESIPQAWLDAVKASEKKYRPVSLETLTPRVAEIGDKLFRSFKD